MEKPLWQQDANICLSTKGRKTDTSTATDSAVVGGGTSTLERVSWIRKIV